LIFGAVAAVMAAGERPFFRQFAKLWGILVALGIASVLLSSLLRRLDIAFGDHPWLVLLVVVTGIVLILRVVKLVRRGNTTDA
jgi:hypothetical protein